MNKRKYEEPIAEIEKFNLDSFIVTSQDPYDDEVTDDPFAY